MFDQMCAEVDRGNLVTRWMEFNGSIQQVGIEWMAEEVESC